MTLVFQQLGNVTLVADFGAGGLIICFFSTGSEWTGPLELMGRYVTGEVCLRGVEIVCSEPLHDEFQRIRLVHVQPQNLCFAIFPRFRGYRQSRGHGEPEMEESGSPLRIRGMGKSTESRTVLWSERTRRIGSYIIPTWQLGQQGSGAGDRCVLLQIIIKDVSSLF